MEWNASDFSTSLCFNGSGYKSMIDQDEYDYDVMQRGVNELLG